MLYNGINLELPDKKPQMTHSVFGDMITGRPGNQNVDWFSALGAIPWGKFKAAHEERFRQASNIFSLANMNYQVCNGGIGQYFCNTYNEPHAPFHENDVAHYDLDTQKEFFSEMVMFAKGVFPERLEENTSLEKACNAFKELWFEADAEGYETIECDEDEYIYDEELGEEIPNPDYFEPYEETTYEDVIHGEAGFDKTYFDANDYLEELIELQAQVCCKQLVLEVQKDKVNASELLKTLKEVVPESAFVKPSLKDQILSASARASQSQGKEKELQPEL